MERTQFFIPLTTDAGARIFINHVKIDALLPMFENGDERLPKGTKVYTSGGEYVVKENVEHIVRSTQQYNLIKEVK